MSNNHLILGLGGTGGKIIRELRKTIERSKDASGNSISDANFKFLYVDTSRDELEKVDQWSVLGTDVSLKRAEQLTFTASNLQPVLNDPGAYPGFKDWIEPRSAFGFVKGDLAGAGQRRKLGRAIFAQNAGKFIAQVQDCVRELETEHGKGATIHIVCGLAGGTGSGSVVDAVALIRNHYPDSEKYRILIYAVLPEMYSKYVKEVSGFSTYYANGYAALSELNALATHRYQPVNLLDGSRIQCDVSFFNGCYLVNNVNEHHVQFDIQIEVPQLVAEFIFQKTVNKQWTGLRRAETGENIIENFECNEVKNGEERPKDRSRLFMSFGITRLVAPEQEIKEYLAYGMAEQAARQLMYNNFRQGEGYADEPLQKDAGFEARKPDMLQKLLLSDTHLMLDTGLLEDDASATWKPPHEYWKLIVSKQLPKIKAEIAEQSSWIPELNNRLSKVFDDTYRMMGGVRKFYEVKGKARINIAEHIGRYIAKELFGRWKSGDASLVELRDFTDELNKMLDERRALLMADINKMPAELDAINSRIEALRTDFNKVGFFGKHLTDKRESLFTEIGACYQDSFTQRTRLEGLRFACELIPFIKDKLTALRGAIDKLNQNLGNATDKVRKERQARLGSSTGDTVYQKREFDREAIVSLLKALTSDEDAQNARTRSVREAVIQLAGAEVNSFDKLQDIAQDRVIQALSQESAKQVEQAQGEVAKARNLKPVLNINIVERLQKRNLDDLDAEVKRLYAEAGVMLTVNKAEEGKGVPGLGVKSRRETTGIFLPACDEQKEFRAKLQRMFEDHRTSATSVEVGSQNNQIVILKIASYMPVRFVETLADLKKHYDGLRNEEIEAVLMHGEGLGDKLPPLYAPTEMEMAAMSKRKPYVLAARLLGMVKERQNKTSGLQEWVFSYVPNGLPKVLVLQGKTWQDVLESEQPADVQAAIEKEVAKRISADYKHVDRKQELRDAYNKMTTDRFNEMGEDDQDPFYLTLYSMQEPLCEIIGLQLQEA